MKLLLGVLSGTLGLLLPLTVSAAPLGVVLTIDPITLQSGSPIFSTAVAPNSIAAGNGSIYVTFPDGAIHQYASAGGALQDSFSLGFLFAFSNLTFGEGGLLGVQQGPTIGTRMVKILDFDSGGFTIAIINTPAAANSVASGNGSVYTTFPDGAIHQYASVDGALQNSFSLGFLYAFSNLTFGDGRLWGMLQGPTIGIGITPIIDFQSNGFTLGNYFTLASPVRHLAVGGNRIYATFADGTISSFSTTTGELLASATHPGLDWTGLSLFEGTLYASAAEVPEAATWGLALSGLLAMLVLRRRT